MSKEAMQMALDALVNWDARSRLRVIEALRTALAQPEPVAVWELEDSGWEVIADADMVKGLPIGTKLYTAPPQRKEWVGLAADDRINCEQAAKGNFFALYAAIEAKLKENNGY